MGQAKIPATADEFSVFDRYIIFVEILHVKNPSHAIDG